MENIEEVFTAEINPQMDQVNDKYMVFAKKNYEVQVTLYLAAKDGKTCDKSEIEAREKTREESFQDFMATFEEYLPDIWKHLTIDKLRTMPIDVSGVIQKHIKAMAEKAASQKIHSRIEGKEMLFFCSQDQSIPEIDLTGVPENDFQVLTGGKPVNPQEKSDASEDNNSVKSEKDDERKAKLKMKALIDTFTDVPDPVKEAIVLEITPSKNTIKLQIDKPDCYGQPLLGYKVDISSISRTGESSNSVVELDENCDELILPDLANIRDLILQIRAVNSVGTQEEAFTLKLRLPTRHKEVWMFGRNELNQIDFDLVDAQAKASIDSNEDEDHYCETWAKISFKEVGIEDLQPAKIVSKSSTLCIVDNCELVQWGLSFSLEEGSVKEHPSAMFLRKGLLVNSLSIGNAFCAVSTIDGRVFTWGDNRFGQLGQGNYSAFVEKPTLVSTLVGHFVVDIKAGFGHCICLTDTGKVFTWGMKQAITGEPVRNRFGDEISFNNPGMHQPLPQDITTKYLATDDKVIQILSSEFYLGMVTQKGYLYIWGDNDYSMFGEYPAKNSVIPIRIDLKGKVKRASFGLDHNLVEISTGEEGQVTYLAWGNNKHHQCGVAKSVEVTSPTEVTALKSIKVKDFSCGVARTYIIDEQGGLHMLGMKYKGLVDKDTLTLKKIKDQAGDVTEQNGTMVVHF